MDFDRHYNVVGDFNTMLLHISPIPFFDNFFKYFTSSRHQQTTRVIILLLLAESASEDLACIVPMCSPNYRYPAISHFPTRSYCRSLQ